MADFIYTATNNLPLCDHEWSVLVDKKAALKVQISEVRVSQCVKCKDVEIHIVTYN